MYHLATIHSVIDRQTDRRTDRHYHANSRSQYDGLIITNIYINFDPITIILMDLLRSTKEAWLVNALTTPTPSLDPTTPSTCRYTTA